MNGPGGPHRSSRPRDGGPGDRAGARAQQSVDLVLLGGGGAGLAVLHHLARALLAAPEAAPVPPRERRAVRVVVVDPVDRLADRPADRTWCCWLDPAGATAAAIAPAVHRAWREVVLVGADGRPQVLDLDPLRYTMVRSEDWYALVAADVAAARGAGLLDVVHERRTAGESRWPDPGAWVLDSRPAPPVRAGASSLLQHFRGQRLRTASASVDPARAVLMDFTVPQPPVGLAFGYLLPSDERTALVEYTEFSPAPLAEEEYAGALAAYAARALGGPDVLAGARLEHTEAGVIPMSDAVRGRRPGPRAWAIGTAGGAVRPSTGYAFAAMQRQGRAVAAQVVAQLGSGVDGPGGLGRLVVPRPYPRRHAWMDALVLRALLDGSLDGPAFFTRLFARNPPARVLAFLDGLSGPRAELELMASTPRAVMSAAALADAAGRVRRRLAR